MSKNAKIWLAWCVSWAMVWFALLLSTLVIIMLEYVTPGSHVDGPFVILSFISLLGVIVSGGVAFIPPSNSVQNRLTAAGRELTKK